MTIPPGPHSPYLTPLLARALRALRHGTGLPVAFGGPVSRNRRGFVIDQLNGARTTSLLGLRVQTGAGLGGRVLALARPWVVNDYFSAEEITHVYDHAVAPEHLQSIAAAPVLVDGIPRAVLYVASRSSVDFGDRLLESVAHIVQQVEWDLAVEEEVRRRLAATLPTVKATEVAELVAELSQIAATVQDEGIRRRLIEVCRRTRLLAGRFPPTYRPVASTATTVRLSPRERDVLAEVAKGYTNDEVAEALGLLPNTVKSYLKSAMRKLGATNRLQAVNLAREAGVLDR